MPNIHELVDNVRASLSEKSIGKVWFTKLDLENAYNHLALDVFTSKQGNITIQQIFMLAYTKMIFN